VLAGTGIPFDERFPLRSARPAGAGWSGRHWFQGFAKNAHPWLSSSRSSGAENQSFPSAAPLQEMYKLQAHGAQVLRQWKP
jgi:hypothetical protein